MLNNISLIGRVLDVVALSSEDYKMWLNGLQLLLHLGSHNASRVCMDDLAVLCMYWY